MNKETYEALIYIMDCIMKGINNIKKSPKLCDSMKAVDDWIDEVAKEYDSEECDNEQVSI